MGRIFFNFDKVKIQQNFLNLKWEVDEEQLKLLGLMSVYGLHVYRLT